MIPRLRKNERGEKEKATRDEYKMKKNTGKGPTKRTRETKGNERERDGNEAETDRLK